MSDILAIETSSDACSIAILRDGSVNERYVVEPRRHNQIVFQLLNELIDSQTLSTDHFDAIAYGAGPGSFTGLRIAASVVQGLSYASGIPAIGVSTLSAIAQRALREGRVPGGDTVLACMDAKVGDMYCALYRFANGVAELEEGPWVTKPGAFSLPASVHAHLVGDSVQMVSSIPDAAAQQLITTTTGVMPTARDVAFLANTALETQQPEKPHQVQPAYVREEISWKKLSEQGRRA